MNLLKYTPLRVAKIAIHIFFLFIAVFCLSEVAHAGTYGGNAYGSGDYSVSSPSVSPTSSTSQSSSANQSTNSSPSPTVSASSPQATSPASPASSGETGPLHDGVGNNQASPSSTPESTQSTSSGIWANILEIIAGILAILGIYFWFRRRKSK